MDFHNETATGQRPEFWYGLPYGYLPLDLQPSAEGIHEAARQINSLPSEARNRADQVFRLYAAVLTMLRKQHVLGCALGMHPDESGNPSLSVLTASSVPTSGVNPKAVLVQMLEQSDAGNHRNNGILPVKLPIGTGFAIESERRTTAPTAPPEGQEGPVQENVWQGTVAIPDVRSSSIVTIQLVTPAVELSDAYRGVLLGVARTVTFTDPAQPGESNRRDEKFSTGPEPDDRSPFG